MSLISSTDPEFLKLVESWLKEQSEILLMIRYANAGGARDFEIHTSFQDLSERLRQLAPCTSIIVFRSPQLPLRGVVDDNFIAECLKIIPDGSEYLIVEGVKRVYGRMSWYRQGSGESHEELLEDLKESFGVPVIAGLYPPWLEDKLNIAAAYVPDKNGILNPGAY